MLVKNIDDLDMGVLFELSKNAKVSLKELSHALGVPPSTIHARMKKLESNGIIKEYSIRVDHKKLGLELMAFVMVRFQQMNNNVNQISVAKEISKLSRVQEVFILAGDFDMLLKVRARSIDDLSELVVKYLRGIKGVGQTLTYIVLMPIKEENNCLV